MKLVKRMIKSMTGFGRGEACSDYGKVTVELKSVNHRYLDLNMKLPRGMSAFEQDIRTLLKQQISRGKVDMYVTFAFQEGSAEEALVYHEEVAKAYVYYGQKISEQFGLKNDLSAATLMRYPDVCVTGQREMDGEQMMPLLQDALHQALAQFVETRTKEGHALAEDLLAKLDYMEALAKKLEARYPQVLTDYRKRLLTKVQELLASSTMDEARVVTEVVIYADKTCIDEEIVRLHSHIGQMREILKSQSGVGRKLDFIAQEMNREANTMLSKTNDLEMTDLAIDLKTEIEKVREQIQNLE